VLEHTHTDTEGRNSDSDWERRMNGGRGRKGYRDREREGESNEGIGRVVRKRERVRRKYWGGLDCEEREVVDRCKEGLEERD
jgi:hypothetical protein